MSRINRSTISLVTSAEPGLKLERTFSQLLLESTKIGLTDGYEFDGRAEFESQSLGTKKIIQIDQILREDTDQPVFRNEGPKLKLAASLQMQPPRMAFGQRGRDRVYAFKDDEFQGEVTLFEAYISAADESYADMSIFPAREALREEDGLLLTLSIGLRHEDLNRLLRPMWLGSGRYKVRISIGLVCFRFGAEMAFSELGDDDSLVVDATKYSSVELRSLEVIKDSRVPTRGALQTRSPDESNLRAHEDRPDESLRKQIYAQLGRAASTLKIIAIAVWIVVGILVLSRVL